MRLVALLLMGLVVLGVVLPAHRTVVGGRIDQIVVRLVAFLFLMGLAILGVVLPAVSGSDEGPGPVEVQEVVMRAFLEGNGLA